MAQACGLQHEDHRHWQDGTESRYEILEKYTHEKLSDALNLVFVELGRFRKKSLHDIDNDKERFYMHEFTGMPVPEIARITEIPEEKIQSLLSSEK